MGAVVRFGRLRYWRSEIRDGKRTLERLDVAAGQGDADLVDLGALAEVLLRLVYSKGKSALKFLSCIACCDQVGMDRSATYCKTLEEVVDELERLLVW